MRRALEVHVQILREVPAQREVSVPKELLAERDWQFGVFHALHVAFLKLVVAARYLCIESDVLRQPVQTESTENVQPLALVLQLLEWFECLIDRCPRIVQRTAPVVFRLIHRRLTTREVMAMAIGQREVRRVVRHGVTLVLYAHSHVGKREVGARCLCHGDAFHRVALVLVERLESVVELHISIERIVSRACELLRH